MQITGTYHPKLNKKPDGSLYAIEEQLALVAGQFEGYLAHDNIVNSSIRVYRGPQMSGGEVHAWTLSVPSDAPWQRIIRVNAPGEHVYVTYETPGDTVDADDVNVLQEAVSAVAEELVQYVAQGVIDGGYFNVEEENN